MFTIKLRAYKKVGKKTIYSEYSNVSSAMSGFAGPYNIKMAFDGKNNAITFGKCAGAAGTEISVRKGDDLKDEDFSKYIEKQKNTAVTVI